MLLTYLQPSTNDKHTTTMTQFVHDKSKDDKDDSELAKVVERRYNEIKLPRMLGYSQLLLIVEGLVCRADKTNAGDAGWLAD